jgi:transposase-like protein
LLLTAQRDQEAALRFLQKAIRRHGVPEKITSDGSEAHAAAVRSYNTAHVTSIGSRQVKSRHHSLEQDHRAVKCVTRPRLGFQSCEAAPSTLGGLELMHLLHKGQREDGVEPGRTTAEQFYALASSSPH